MMKRVYFFLGKGGVGKTTSAASLALNLARRGFSVFWASIDPAHNLWDVLGMEGGSGVRRVEGELWAQEVDLEAYIRRFLADTTCRMKELYRHLQILNLEGMLDVLRYSPGMEESAVLFALRDLMETHRDKDYLVIDTPPTGLTLRIFSLPFSILLWIDQLKKWREKILERRSIVRTIKGKEALGEGVAQDREGDKVYRELERQEEQARYMAGLLQDGRRVANVLVMNQDRLSFKESCRIRSFLERVAIPLRLILLNKFGLVEGGEIVDEAKVVEAFSPLPVRTLPFVRGDLEREDLVSLGKGWVEELM